jgi:hypothetical protein
MKKAVIRLGPLFDGHALELAKRNQIEPGRYYYTLGGLELLPHGKSKVLINHDTDGASIGRVDELHRWSDGDGEWLAARCLLDDDPPDWVRQGTAASIALIDTLTRPLGAGTRFGAGFVTEVSLISPTERPREPMARVVLLRDVVDPWNLPPKTLAELGPLTEKNALDVWTARIELGEDPSAAYRDIEAKLAAQKGDARLGRRSNIQPSGHARQPRSTRDTSPQRTILGIPVKTWPYAGSSGGVFL